jgi:UDP-glucuronate decarboxylase
MKRILIAGGAGFLGSHLCERMVSSGHYVICIDNFRTGRRANFVHLRSHPRFRFVEHDIIKPLSLPGPLDEIYNLACPASPPHYQRDPHYTVMVNVIGVSNLVELARTKKARLLQASTSEVYGDPLNEEQTETDWGHVNCTGPRACYDEGKRCAETILFDEWRRHEQPIKVARIFNTYGPRMQENDGRIISNFIVQALTREPLTVYGDGSQTRSFCYVDDLIDGLIRLMQSPQHVTGPINLGNPEELKVIDVAHRVTKLAGVRSPKIVLKPLPVDDPHRRRPNIAKAKAALGWKPTTPLDTGLERTIAYFREQLALNAAAEGRKGGSEALTPEKIVSMGAARVASV